MAIGYLFVAITAAALLSMALANINDHYGYNKIGNLSVVVFWWAIAELYVYVFT